MFYTSNIPKIFNFTQEKRDIFSKQKLRKEDILFIYFGQIEQLSDQKIKSHPSNKLSAWDTLLSRRQKGDGGSILL